MYARVCACARFGAGGHTFNFARPITKSDMHHSEINSQQQRAHVLFVMSRSNSPERVGRARRRSARKMSPAVVAGSSYLPSELPVNDNPWCRALPCLSHVYQLSLSAASHRIILRPNFVFSSKAISRYFVRPADTRVQLECRFTFIRYWQFNTFIMRIAYY